MTSSPTAPVPPPTSPPAPASLRVEAERFLALPEIDATAERRRAVHDEIGRTGTYVHTSHELLAGARLAWRNNARCLGRMHWRALRLHDARHVRTGAEVAEHCWEHLRWSTNGGAIRSLVTVFPPRRPDGSGIEIRNPQLVRYAGHRRADGSVWGDPAHVDLTEQARALGWRGAGTRFDVLPLVVDVPGQAPHLEVPPADVVLEVPITHPDLDFVADLGLRWHANPAISSTSLEIGGLSYSAAPFTGWYVSSEIGARNFSDRDRYDLLPTVAAGMGLDTSSDRTLWRDRAMLELNRAVLHSYRAAGVHIVDHHTAAAQFVAHVDREEAAGRPVPAEWSWVNPPISSGLTPTFFREYAPPAPEARPAFLPRADGGAGATGGCPMQPGRRSARDAGGRGQERWSA